MNLKSKTHHWMLAGIVAAAAVLPAAQASADGAAGTAAQVVSDTDLAAELGILQGEGSGLTDAYLSKPTTRLQAAILYLRMKGLEGEAAAFSMPDRETFSDAVLVWPEGRNILAYLKHHPELGWTGIGGGKFDPLSGITSEQVYKVMLEAVGYKQDQDFTYDKVLEAARLAGLGKEAAAKPFRNVNMASALVESLSIPVKGAGKTLAEVLTEKRVIKPDALKALSYDSLSFAASPELGSYLADSKGRTLYYFSKDSANLNSCQGKCLENWPVYYSEKLKVPAGLKKEDFGTLTRADGTKQTTYKGWPLYYYIGDKAPGDTFGEAVNKIWYVVEAPSFAAIGQKEGIGLYLTDSYGRTLYTFDKDSYEKSACSGTCETNWPVYYEEAIQAPTGTDQADFTTMTRADGSKQTAYKGAPLYRFSKDGNRGDTLGQNVNNIWHAVDPFSFAGTAKPAGKSYQVDISGFAFGIPELTVEAGSTVTFTNLDSVRHNAAAVDGSFATPLLSKGSQPRFNSTSRAFTITYASPIRAA
ncbi:hypothetical protein N6H14_31400 [Paenibacillus sp. CC-CFT747]|nr:hypothetical protein N6H14_31400 [Paenibacillus sp. CC-CFT747]